MGSLASSGVGHWSITAQAVAGQLVEFVTRVSIVTGFKTAGGHVRDLVQITAQCRKRRKEFGLTIAVGQGTWRRAVYVPVGRRIVDGR